LLSIVNVQGHLLLQMLQQCSMMPFCAQWCQKCVVVRPLNLSQMWSWERRFLTETRWYLVCMRNGGVPS
jgi:hypothetical protein